MLCIFEPDSHGKKYEVCGGRNLRASGRVGWGEKEGEGIGKDGEATNDRRDEGKDKTDNARHQFMRKPSG